MTISSTILRTTMTEHLNLPDDPILCASSAKASDFSFVTQHDTIGSPMLNIPFSEACYAAELVGESAAENALHLATAMRISQGGY